VICIFFSCADGIKNLKCKFFKNIFFIITLG
jgi:hypothetical protein